MLDIGKAFFNKIQEAKDESNGSISVNQVMDIFKDTIKPFVDNQSELNIFNEIEKISEQLKSAKEELKQLNPKNISDNFIPSAASELAAVTKETEHSTNSILDSAERIQGIVMNINEEEIKNQILNEVTIIFEACNFQDITVQRLMKTAGILKKIEEITNSLIKVSSDDGSNTIYSKTIETMPEKKGDRALMNGPQLPDQASSQNDIDNLFGNS